MYWTIGSFPELQHLSDAERRIVMERCKCNRAMVDLFCWSLTIGSVVGMICVAAFWGFTGLRLWICALVIPLLGIMFYQVQMILIRGRLRIYLEKVGRRERLPLCLNCGYNVEGVQSGVCPECGKKIGTGAGDL